MGSGGFLADGALEAELTVLRARAYGVDADIDADPVAVARLAELEELHAASAARTAQGSDELDGRGRTQRTTPAAADISGARPRWWRRTRAGAFLAGVAVAAATALAVAGWMLWTAPRPDATLHPTGLAPSEQVLRLTDYARRQMVEKQTLRAFEPILGLEVWSAHTGLGNTCLLIIEPFTDDLLDRLRYLHYGIAFILAFIGLKLVFHAMHVNELPFINGGEPIEWAPEISTWMSLGVIIISMLVATVASLVASAREKKMPNADAAAAVVADEKGTPPTVDQPRSDDAR